MWNPTNLWERALRAAALTLFCVPTLWPAREPPLPVPAPWTHDARLPSSCGRAVVIAALLAHPHPRGEDGPRDEAVLLVNQSPGPVDLWRWELRAGRRRAPLGASHLAPGAALRLDQAELGSLRLRNHDGALDLVDRCGETRDRVRWGVAEAGTLWTRPSDAVGGSPLPLALEVGDPSRRALFAQAAAARQRTSQASKDASDRGALGRGPGGPGQGG